MNCPFAKLAPEKVCPLQFGPLKILPSANRPPVKNLDSEKTFRDLQKVSDWVSKDAFSEIPLFF